MATGVGGRLREAMPRRAKAAHGHCLRGQAGRRRQGCTAAARALVKWRAGRRPTAEVRAGRKGFHLAAEWASASQLMCQRLGGVGVTLHIKIYQITAIKNTAVGNVKAVLS